MQYDKAFHKLSRFAKNLIATEKDKVELFVNGLRMPLQKDLTMVDLPSYAAALNKALKAEWAREQMKKEQKLGKRKRPYQSSGNGNQKAKKEKTDPKSGSSSENKCPKCGRQHKIEECPMITGSCFHCKEMGHKAANCPEKS